MNGKDARKRRGRKQVVAFIDDDPDELSRFEEALSDDYRVITATSFAQAQKSIGRWRFGKPHLWVLDMYMPEEGVFNTADEIREINRRYFELDAAVRAYRTYLKSLGQGIDGGLSQLKRAKATGVPAIFLTRKGTLDDALVALDHGADGVLKKPMPASWSTTTTTDTKKMLDDAFKNSTPYLIEKFDKVMEKYSFWYRNKSFFYSLFGLIAGIAGDQGVSYLIRIFA
jgi:CheY-like chemotaxis protein